MCKNFIKPFKYKFLIIIFVGLICCDFVTTECVYDDEHLICDNVTWEEIKSVQNKDIFESARISTNEPNISANVIPLPSLTCLEIFTTVFIREIEETAFENYTSLEKLIISLEPLEKLQTVSNSNPLELKENTLNKLQQLEDLKISTYVLTKIHKRAFHSLKNLTDLDLSGNQITEIDPNLFDGMPNLEFINFNINNISNLPADMFKYHHNLLSFDFGWNKISSIPDNLFKTTENMVEIDLSGNKISRIFRRTFSKLQNLEILNLNQNSIEHIHKYAFIDLNNLEILDLSHNRLGTCINFVNFHCLPNLKLLNLAYSNIRKLNGTIFANTNLEELNLQGNTINHLNTKMFRHVGKLRKLYLDYNQIEDIDANAFNDLKKVEELSIKSNQLMTLRNRTFVQMVKLTKLNLAENRISEIELEAFGFRNSYSPVRQLLLRKNKISHVNSAAFAMFKNLEVLNLSQNNLQEVPADFFKSMINLKELDLSHNSIQNFHENTFKNLGNSLLTLKMYSTKFEYLSSKIFGPLKKLTFLDMDVSDVMSIDEDFFSTLPELRSINLNSNKLSYLPPKLVQCAENKSCKLQTFEVADNKLHFLDKSFLENSTITQLNLVFNPWSCECLRDLLAVLDGTNLDVLQRRYLNMDTCIKTPFQECTYNIGDYVNCPSNSCDMVKISSNNGLSVNNTV